MKVFILFLFPIFINFNCKFLKENLPLTSPGLGIEKENSKFLIYFDIGIFTIPDYKIDKNEFINFTNQVVLEIEKEFDFLRLKPIIDQPLDALFIIQKTPKRKKNFLIQKKEINLQEWEFYNPILIQNKQNKKLYFLYSELENYFYNQVRYDIIIFPLEIYNDSNISAHLIVEKQFFISKGRSALDKMSYSVYLDYENLENLNNFRKLKDSILSLIFYIEPEKIHLLQNEKKYISIRKEILELYYNYNKGKKQIKCLDLIKLEEKLNNNEFYKQNSHYFKIPLEENFDFLKKKCK